MLIVQSSSGLYLAAQYDGTNGAEIVAALQALSPSTSGGILSFTAFRERAGQPLSGHRFYVPTGYWVVWSDTDHQYVVAVLTDAEFQDQYQPVCDCAALDAAKVNRAGDTMTGELVLAGTGPQLLAGEALMTVMSTGILYGGEININVDPTKVDITAAVGYIVDYVTTPSAPTLTRVSIPAQIGLVLTGPLSQITTWWLADVTGASIQQAPNPTNTQRRTHLVFGATSQFGGTVFLDQTLPGWHARQPGAQVVDLMESLGPHRTQAGTALLISANGANLSINNTSGPLFSRYFNLFAGPTLTNDPNITTLAAQAPCSFRLATATTVLPGVTTFLDAANYDPGGLGVVTPIGPPNNNTTIHRVYAFATNNTVDQMAIQYGQSVYASLSIATAAIGSGTFIPNPLFVDGALIGYIAATRTATDLSDVTQATFTRAGKFPTP